MYVRALDPVVLDHPMLGKSIDGIARFTIHGGSLLLDNTKNLLKLRQSLS